MSEVKCPKCGGIHFIRKGKSKDKQFQKLKCKSCNKYYSVECFKVNKQINFPEFKTVIVEHPDGMFSVNKIRLNTVKGIKFVKNLDFVTTKVNSYESVVELASKLTEDIDPDTYKLDNFVSEELQKQLKILFPPSLAKSIEDLLEEICKDMIWTK